MISDKTRLKNNIHNCIDYITFPMGMGDVISYGWRFTLVNINEFILYVLPAAMVLAFFVRLTFLSMKDVFIFNSDNMAYWVLNFFILWPFYTFMSCFAFAFFGICFIKAIYSTLEGNFKGYKQIYSETLKDIWMIAKTAFLLVGMVFKYIVGYLILMLILMFILSGILHMINFVFAILINLSLTAFVIYKIITSLIRLPFNLVFITIKDTTVMKSDLYTYVFFRRNYYNMTNFSIVLSLLVIGILTIFNQLPDIVFVALSMLEIREINEIIKILITYFFNIMGFFIIFILLIAPSSLFVYNHKAQKEGKDLLYHINSMKTAH